MSDHGTNGSSGDPVLRLTPPALAEILELKAGEAAPETLALCVEISGTQDDAYTYDMYFQAVADATAGDWIEHAGGSHARSCRDRASTSCAAPSWT